jgi:hypothetical protein
MKAIAVLAILLSTNTAFGQGFAQGFNQGMAAAQQAEANEQAARAIRLQRRQLSNEGANLEAAERNSDARFALIKNQLISK